MPSRVSDGEEPSQEGWTEQNPISSLRTCAGWMVSRFSLRVNANVYVRTRMHAIVFARALYYAKVLKFPPERMRAPLPRYHYTKLRHVCQPLNYEQIMNKKN